jgi:hypothetical protein
VIAGCDETSVVGTEAPAMHDNKATTVMDFVPCSCDVCVQSPTLLTFKDLQLEMHTVHHFVPPMLVLTGAHFFCETIDLSRPFPSDRPVTQPSWEFVWNRWLTASFRGIGLDFVCPPLLQVSFRAGNVLF